MGDKKSAKHICKKWKVRVREMKKSVDAESTKTVLAQKLVFCVQ